MCRKLLCLVALLGIASVVSAVDPLPPGTITMIDDFEGYFGTPAMVTPTGPWSGTTEPLTSDILSLVTAAGASAYGTQSMQWEWTNEGGWLNPDDPTDYDWKDGIVGGTLNQPYGFQISNHVMMGTAMDAYNVTNSSTQMTLIHMSLQIPVGAGVPPAQYLLEYGGDQYAQTWIPAPGSGAAWWIPATQIPAKIGPDSDWEWGSQDYSGVPSLEPNGVWLDITVNPDMWVTWGAPLADFDDMTSLDYAAFGNGAPDTSGASGDSKLHGSDVYWPPGPISGTLKIDHIWFEEVIPEPTTIALLGLGGLALIRRKR